MMCCVSHFSDFPVFPYVPKVYFSMAVCVEFLMGPLAEPALSGHSGLHVW